MMSSEGNSRGSLDLLEEAVHLLRRIPLTTLLLHYIGTFPFLLALLYFLADMSRGPTAHLYVAEAALGVSLLYIWMKCWQSVFCGRIYTHLLGQPPQPFQRQRLLRLIATQALIQPYGLILIPVAFLILLPFGWTFAFFHNVLVTGSGAVEVRKAIQAGWRLALLWPAQNHRLVIVLSLFSFFVFLNIGILLWMVPALLRMLFGVETIFSISGFHLLNTTFLSILMAFTYLCIHPLLAIVYTLRCFYGEAIQSGADLLAELQSLRKVS